MSHTYEFKVWGDNFADIESKARGLCLDYFSTPDFTLNIEAEARHLITGAIAYIEADCSAHLTGGAA